MKNKGGRPSSMTPDVIAKLEEAFYKGHSDEEACLLAEIDLATLYRYCNKHPRFATKKELLKETPSIMARESLLRGVKEDPELALKYMERKRRREFATRSETDITTDGEKITGFTYVKSEELPHDKTHNPDDKTVK